MTNAQSNLAALGTKPIQFNLGEIYLNQMNYLAKTKGEEEAARAKARAERAKERGDIISKQKSIDPILTNGYFQHIGDQTYKGLLDAGEQADRDFELGLIDQYDYKRRRNEIENVPSQLKNILDTGAANLKVLQENSGDEVLNKPALDFLERTFGEGKVYVKQDPKKGTLVVTYNDEGEEVPHTLSEFESMMTVGDMKVYKDKVDTDKFWGDAVNDYGTIKRGDGTYSKETSVWKNDLPKLVEYAKKIAPTYNDMLNSPDLKKSWLESGQKLKPFDSVTQEEYDKWLNETADKRGRVHYKEVNVDTTEYGARRKKDLDIANAEQNLKNSKLEAIKKGQEIRTGNRTEADETGANTKIELGGINLGKDPKTGKEKLIHTTLFTPTKPIQYQVGDKEGGAIYNISSFHVDRDGFAYIPNDQIGIATEGVTKVNMTSDQSFLANALKLGTGENMRGIAKEYLDKNRPVKNPSTIDRIKNATNNVVERVRSLAGNKPPRTPDNKQSNKMIRMSVNGQPYDVPADKVSALLKKYPKAKRL